MMPRDPAFFEAEHRLNFNNKALLKTAFVHSSYVNELDAATQEVSQEDNERLEFLGDSVLGFVVSEWLFARFPNSREGELTAMRAALVKREALARFAKRLGLGDYLLLGHGEEESGGRKRIATLAATFEAVVCAIYLDQGRDAVRNFLLPILHAETEREILHALHKDPKSRLQEWSQGTLGILPRYKLVDQFGPDHAKTFIFQVALKEARVGVGEGGSKQEAQLAAAAMALHYLNLAAPEYVENAALEAHYPPDPPDARE
jgi:ribonuclease-3